MKKDNDCYFFVDSDIPEEERTILPLCIECHDKKLPYAGWFYKGSEEGYGPFDYECTICGFMIHSGKNPDKE